MGTEAFPGGNQHEQQPDKDVNRDLLDQEHVCVGQESGMKGGGKEQKCWRPDRGSAMIHYPFLYAALCWLGCTSGVTYHFDLLHALVR